GRVDYMPAAHWRDIEANRQIRGRTESRTREAPLTTVWMQHPHRRAFDRVVIDARSSPPTSVRSPSGTYVTKHTPGRDIRKSGGACDRPTARAIERCPPRSRAREGMGTSGRRR